jgi:hypothetical protein
MTPDVPMANVAVQEEVRPATEPPLSALLILPVPAPAQRRSVWWDFLHDMTYLLPAFGLLLGTLLAFGQARLGGVSLLLASLAALSIRLHFTLAARRERQQLAALEKLHRDHREEFEQQWKRQLTEGS